MDGGLNIHSGRLPQLVSLVDLTNDKTKFNRFSTMLVPNRFKIGQSHPLTKIEA